MSFSPWAPQSLIPERVSPPPHTHTFSSSISAQASLSDHIHYPLAPIPTRRGVPGALRCEASPTPRGSPPPASRRPALPLSSSANGLGWWGWSPISWI